MTASLPDLIVALENAEGFSQVKRAMVDLVATGELEALDALLPSLLRTENENLLFFIGRQAMEKWDEAVLSRIDLDGASDQEKANALHLCLWDGGDLAQAMLVEAASDPSLMVRRTALRLLGELKERNPEVLDILEEAALSDEFPAARKAAIKALAATRDPRAIPILEKVLAQTNDESVEDLLIDLRLHVIEEIHPGLIPAQQTEGTAVGTGARPTAAQIGQMSRFEFVVHQMRDQILEILGPLGSVVRGSFMGGKDGRSLSIGRLILCLVVSGLFAFAVINYRSAVARIRPHAQQTAFACPFCGASQDQVLSPSSQCDGCGRSVFANRGYGDASLATTIAGRENSLIPETEK